MNWSIGYKILAGYGLAVVVLSIIGLTSYHSVVRFQENVELRRQSHEVLFHVERLLGVLKDAETGQRGYLITGASSYKDRYQSALKHVDEALDELDAATRPHGDAQTILKQVRELVGARLKSLAEGFTAYEEDGYDKAKEYISQGRGKDLMDQILTRLAPLRAAAEQDLQKRSDEARKNASFSTFTIASGSAIAFVVLGAVGFLVSRNISRPLDAAINVLMGSSGQIASATMEIATNATETATAVTQTTATVAEVKQTALAAVQKAKYVADIAQQTAQASQTGTRAVEEMITGINRIREQTDSVAASIVRLSEQSQAIGAIIATVDDLAAQSNLLAVNAAIEAAKAGEQGKGFAVVAQEVKSLADQSKQATAQVRTILNDIQKATSAAVMATEQSSKAVEGGLRQAAEAGQSVRTLSDSIAQSSQAAIQIAASSQQQLVGMDQLAQAMESIKAASIQNANGTKQTEAAAQSLTELGQRLKRIVAGDSHVIA
jgi:methyl-accepting chemotaxis protein